MNRDKWNDSSKILPEEYKEVLVANGNDGDHIIAYIQYDSDKKPHWKQAGIADWKGDISEWNRWIEVLVG